MANEEVKVKVAAAMQQSSKTKEIAKRVSTQGNLSGLKQSEIGEFLSGMKPQIANAIPKHLSADRILQQAVTIIHGNPKIAACTTQSLIGAVMQASILGFPPVSTLGLCYFIPYGKDISFQLGYKGILELARRSGNIKEMYAEVVREGDIFECEYGLDQKLIHKPMLNADKPITHVYAVAKFIDGGHNFVVLSKSEIEKLRLRNPSQAKTVAPSGVWVTDYDAMAKAKALKQLAKYLPLSIDVMKSIATDEAILTPDNFQNGEAEVEYADYTIQNDDNPATGNPATETTTEPNENGTLNL